MTRKKAGFGPPPPFDIFEILRECKRERVSG
jgi:hypothetical protein